MLLGQRQKLIVVIQLGTVALAVDRVIGLSKPSSAGRGSSSAGWTTRAASHEDHRQVRRFLHEEAS